MTQSPADDALPAVAPPSLADLLSDVSVSSTALHDAAVLVLSGNRAVASDARRRLGLGGVPAPQAEDDCRKGVTSAEASPLLAVWRRIAASSELRHSLCASFERCVRAGQPPDLNVNTDLKSGRALPPQMSEDEATVSECNTLIQIALDAARAASAAAAKQHDCSTR